MGALTAALVGLYGLGPGGYVAYDAMYALIWGDEIARLHAPSYGALYSPTPHPLWNLIGVVLAPFGNASSEFGMRLISLAAAVLLGVAAFRLGRALYSAWAGALFAFLLLSRPQLYQLFALTSVDVEFLALVLFAAALEAERPRRGVSPMVVLGLAGLLRPEAWLFAAAYGVYMLWADGRERLPVAALALAGPLLWMASDLVLAGDPLFSLHRTGHVASELQPQRGFVRALRLAPQFVEELLGGVVFWLGIAGSVLCVRVRTEKMALPAALIALSIIPFLAYGLARLTLYARFLLPTCAMLALFCAVLVVYLVERAGLTRARIGWTAAAAAAVVALVATVPSTIRSGVHEQALLSTRRHLEDDLVRVVSGRMPAAAYRGCPVVQVPGRVVIPELIRAIGVRRDAFAESPQGRLRRGLELTIPATSRRKYILNPSNIAPLRDWQRVPESGLPLLAQSRLWRLNGSC